MARVKVEIEEVDDIEDEEDEGHNRKGVRATCSRCDHVTESFGIGPKSRIRCALLMREECPNNEENFYIDEDWTPDRPAEPVPKPWWEKGR
jgi:hypothetical protein